MLFVFTSGTSKVFLKGVFSHLHLQRILSLFKEWSYWPTFIICLKNFLFSMRVDKIFHLNFIFQNALRQNHPKWKIAMKTFWSTSHDTVFASIQLLIYECLIILCLLSKMVDFYNKLTFIRKVLFQCLQNL